MADTNVREPEASKDHQQRVETASPEKGPRLKVKTNVRGGAADPNGGWG